MANLWESSQDSWDRVIKEMMRRPWLRNQIIQHLEGLSGIKRKKKYCMQQKPYFFRKRNVSRWPFDISVEQFDDRCMQLHSKWWRYGTCSPTWIRFVTKTVKNFWFWYKFLLFKLLELHLHNVFKALIRIELGKQNMVTRLSLGFGCMEINFCYYSPKTKINTF